MQKPKSRAYGICIDIATWTTSPFLNYSSLAEDPCLPVENRLFAVETRLKRMEDKESEEYEELIEEGKQLRLEWKRLAAEVASTKPQQEPQDFANYDIRKCLSSGKPKKQANQDNQKESGIKIEDLGAIEFGNVESGKAEFDNAGQEDIDQTDAPIDSDDENSELCVV